MCTLIVNDGGSVVVGDGGSISAVCGEDAGDDGYDDNIIVIIPVVACSKKRLR